MERTTLEGLPRPLRPRWRVAVTAAVVCTACYAGCLAAASSGGPDPFRVLRKSGKALTLVPGGVVYWLHRDLWTHVLLELERLPPDELAPAEPWLAHALATRGRLGVPQEWMAEVLRGRRLSPSARLLVRYCNVASIGGPLPSDARIDADTARRVLEHPDLRSITAFFVRDESHEPEPSAGGGGYTAWEDGTSVLYTLGTLESARRITELRVERRGLAILAGAPERTRTLTGLTRLDVDGGSPTADLVARLPALRELSMRGFVAETARDLAPYVTELRSEVSAPASIVEGEVFPRLTRLTLAGHSFDRAFLERLARSDRLPALRSLAIHLDGPVDRADLAAFLGALALPALEELDLRAFGASFDARAIESLARAPTASRLIGLHLYFGTLDEEAARVLGRAPAFAALRALTLGYTKLSTGGLEALFAAPPFRLERLDLASNPLGPRGGALLAAAPSLERLRELGLRETGLGDAGAAALAASSHLGKLEHLDLTSNDLHDDAAIAFSISSTLPALHFLEATAGNHVGPRGRCALDPRFYGETAIVCPR